MNLYSTKGEALEDATCGALFIRQRAKLWKTRLVAPSLTFVFQTMFTVWSPAVEFTPLRISGMELSNVANGFDETQLLSASGEHIAVASSFGCLGETPGREQVVWHSAAGLPARLHDERLERRSS